MCLLVGSRAEGQGWGPAGADGLEPPEMRREYRAAWVAVVANIDWPSRRDLDVASMRAEMKSIVDAAAGLHLNALIVQVRPACDAIYPSELEPWSEFLTGQSGKAPGGGFDPLAEWIALSHEQGMEFHAWFNPFRARHFESKLPDAPSHISNTRPDLVRDYTNLKWLDPGEREAQEHSLRVMLDVVRRYDIDGVHIDDYFYPYPDGKSAFPDDASWDNYVSSGGSLARDDWRRYNINTFVRRMYDETKKIKPMVKVGISPFGIWRPGHPAGVDGMDATQKLFADARLWLNEGWLDYCVPQLYWKIDAPKQPYVKLLEWWTSENKKGRLVVPGNYASRVAAGKASVAGKAPDPRSNWAASEIEAQVKATRACRGASGNVMFSMIALKENRGGLADALRAGPYRERALVPAMDWLPGGKPAKPVASVSAGGEAVTLRFAPGERKSMGTAPEGTISGEVRWWVVGEKRGEEWTVRTLPAASRTWSTPREGVVGVAVSAMDAGGRLGEWAVFVPPR